jgi:hypothetical protein
MRPDTADAVFRGTPANRRNYIPTIQSEPKVGNAQTYYERGWRSSMRAYSSVPRYSLTRGDIVLEMEISRQLPAFFSCWRKNPNLAAHLSDLSARNFALDLGKAKRIVVPNQSNAVRPDSTLD